MKLIYSALRTHEVDELRAGKPDANGQAPETIASDGSGNPCRHCLKEIPAGEPMLVLAWRPFRRLQPYAELGPIFLCAKPCERYRDGGGVPGLYRHRDMLIRGYDIDDRIVYGTGQVVAAANLEREVLSLFETHPISYVHARSPTNNCYHFRIDRG